MDDLSPHGQLRVALVADDLDVTHPVSRALRDLSEWEVPVPGCRLDLISDQTAFIDGLAERRYDVVHACTPGPAGSSAQRVAKAAGAPFIAGFHTITRDRAATGDAAFYPRCDLVLSPTGSADRSLALLGVPRERIARWEPGVDRTRFSPACYGSDILPEAFNVLVVGALDCTSGIDLLADAFLLARDRDPRLHLVLAGRGPDEARLRDRLGHTASFLGLLDDDTLSRVYASADLLVFVDATDAFGQPVPTRRPAVCRCWLATIAARPS